MQDLRFIEESDLVGFPLKAIERRRLLERVSWLKVALAFIGMRMPILAVTSASCLALQA